jgi:hypothetical protein
MQSEQIGDPVVLRDQIEDYVADRVVPVLGGDGYDLGDDARGVRMVGRAAGEAIRRELAASTQSPVELVVASVRRHEARHGIDRDRDTPLRLPLPLAAFLGPHDDDAFALRARGELAAYVAQIASDRSTPQLALWNLATQAFRLSHWGSPESYVAVVVLEGLAARTGAPLHLPAALRGQPDRARLAELVLPLTGLTDDELRIAARALWVDLYGETLDPIE